MQGVDVAHLTGLAVMRSSSKEGSHVSLIVSLNSRPRVKKKKKKDATDLPTSVVHLTGLKGFRFTVPRFGLYATRSAVVLCRVFGVTPQSLDRVDFILLR